MNQPDAAEIEAIAARAEAATPGPWRWDNEGRVWERRAFYAERENDLDAQVMTPHWWPDKATITISEADASFIAHARQDIPTLLAALAAEKERADEAEKWGKEGWDWLDDVLGAIHPDATVFDFRELLAAANYHTATTEPGATGEGS